MYKQVSLKSYLDADCLSESLDQTVVCDLPARQEIKRILIIKWGGMGDIVMSTAAIEDIYQAFPQAVLHLNTLPAWQSLFADDPRFERIWCMNLQQTSGRWRIYRQWLAEVATMQYDLIIDLQTNDKSRLLLSLLRLSGRAPRWLLGNHARFPYTLRQLKALPQAHSFQILRQTLITAGIPALTNGPKLAVSAAAQATAEQLLEMHGLLSQPFAVFLCGSHAGMMTKRWGSEQYAALVTHCIARGERVVLLGGKDEAETCAQIASRHPAQVVNLCGQTPLLAVPAICALAQYIVANDTGTAHLAATTATPMLVLCGPTNPLRVKPVGAQIVALQLDMPCKNCYAKQCGHHSCMRKLTPDQVLPYLPEVKRPHA